MSRYNFVLFDFDGTVADTAEGILKSLQYSFEQMGNDVPEMSELKRFIGPPVHYSYTHFYSISEDEVGMYIKKYRERYKVKGIYESRLFDGIKELLLELKSRGVRIGIASSKPEYLIHNVADHIGVTQLFDAIVGVKTDDSRHSTKTGLILEAMKQLGVNGKDGVLMVGDRCFDIDGATGAGVDSCGALWGYGNEDEFKAHNATFIVKEPSEIINLL